MPFQKGHTKPKNAYRFQKGNQCAKLGKNAWKGKPLPEDIRLKIGLANKGNTPWNFIDGKSNKRERKNKETIKVWCINNGTYSVPPGCLIHHINQNPLDNKIENLQLMTRDFHNKLHSELLKIERGIV